MRNRPIGGGISHEDRDPGRQRLPGLFNRERELHGYEIANSIQRISDDVLQVEEGSLYPALQRMKVKGWVASEWKTSPTGRKARYYTLTTAGRRQLGQETEDFNQSVAAISRVLRSAES